MTLTHETLARPAPLARAVRTVDRWGLLAGVTGFLGNVLFLVLITTSGRRPLRVDRPRQRHRQLRGDTGPDPGRAVPVPAHMLSPDITYAAEWLTGIPVALYPVWLIVLSYRLPGHLAGRVGTAHHTRRARDDPDASGVHLRVEPGLFRIAADRQQRQSGDISTTTAT